MRKLYIGKTRISTVIEFESGKIDWGEASAASLKPFSLL